MSQKTESNLFGFRNFEYQSSAAPDVVAQRLHGLNNPRTSYFQSRSTRVLIDPYRDGTYSFEIQALRRNRTWNYTSVHAVGTLTIDPVTKVTVARGYMKLGLVYMGILVLAALYCLFIIVEEAARPQPGTVFLLILAYIGVFGWGVYTVWADWQELMQSILFAVSTSASTTSPKLGTL